MKKTLKRLSIILACIAALGSLSSCERAGTELSDLMIIQGIGIDVIKQGYKVTVEILNNEQSGSPSSILPDAWGFADKVAGELFAFAF